MRAHTYTQVRLYINNVTALDVPRLRRIFAERANQAESSIGLPKSSSRHCLRAYCCGAARCTASTARCLVARRTMYAASSTASLHAARPTLVRKRHRPRSSWSTRRARPAVDPASSGGEPWHAVAGPASSGGVPWHAVAGPASSGGVSWHVVAGPASSGGVDSVVPSHSDGALAIALKGVRCAAAYYWCGE